MPLTASDLHRPYWAVTTVLLVSLSAIAQDRPALDVVSIREDRLVAQFIPKAIEFQPGRLRIAHYSVSDLVAYAYGISPFHIRDLLIVGWPNTGVKEKRYHVMATLLHAAGAISTADQRRIIQAVLTTRFSFKAHTEQRSVDAYRMVLVKPGVLGRGLHRVDFNCAEIPPSEAPKDKDGRSMCGFGEIRNESGMPRSIRRGSGTVSRMIEAFNGNMNPGAFADVGGPSGPVRVIVDGTGLKGFFVWDYETRPGMGTFEDAVLREQLGLKLERTRVPMDVVVIDDVRMPTPN